MMSRREFAGGVFVEQRGTKWSEKSPDLEASCVDGAEECLLPSFISHRGFEESGQAVFKCSSPNPCFAGDSTARQLERQIVGNTGDYRLLTAQFRAYPAGIRDEIGHRDPLGIQGGGR